MVKKIALFLCVLSMPLLGDSLSGEYGVTGFDPHTRESYRGTVVIKENGDVSDIIWHIKPRGPVYQGTGIRRGDTLSVVFRNLNNANEVGVQTYTIQDDTLAGKWIYLGRNKKGSETLKRL